MKLFVSKSFTDGSQVSEGIGYSTIAKALESIPKDNSDTSILLIDDYYHEFFVIDKPNITLKGVGNLSTIDYDNNHGKIIPLDLGGDGIKTYGTTGSATVTIEKQALNFKAENVCFKNSYKRPDAEAKGTQAVALKVSVNSTFKNCKFIGAQDTLYPDFANKIIFDSCYIEGDVDFIFGAANALFYNCTICAIDNNKNAYFIAPDTYEENKFGFCFYQCNFTKTGNNYVFLGRPWYPGKAESSVLPSALFYKCKFHEDIIFEYVAMSKGTEKEHDMKMLECMRGTEEISDTNSNIEQTRIDFIMNNK